MMLHGPVNTRWRCPPDVFDDCRSVIEDTDGTIWSATNAGLLRYDGSRFTRIGSADGAPFGDLTVVTAGPSGRIWCGAIDGAVSLWRQGQASARLLPDARVGTIRALHPESDGGVWIGSDGGLFRLHGPALIPMPAPPGPATQVSALLSDRQGRLWVGTGHGLFRFDGKAFAPVADPDASIAGAAVYALAADLQDNLWIGCSRGLARFDGRSCTLPTVEQGFPRDPVQTLLIARDGRLWFGTLSQGVGCRLDDRAILFTTRDGLPHNEVSGLVEDREGSIWAACRHGGLAQLEPGGVVPVSNDPVAEAISSAQDGSVWWGRHRTLIRFDGDACRNVFTFPDAVLSIFEDRRRRLWVGTDGGVWRFNRPLDTDQPDPALVPLGDPNSRDPVYAIAESPAGEVWVAAHTRCLLRLDESAGAFLPVPIAGVTRASCLVFDRSGALWAGDRGGIPGGVVRHTSRATQLFTRGDGLPSPCVQSLLVDRSGIVWAGTSEGLCAFEEAGVRRYGPDDGLAGRSVRRIVQDSRGHLWIGFLGGGISRFDGRHFQVLTRADGLPSERVTGIAEGRDGSMVVATYRGVCRYVADCRTPPSVAVDGVEADRLHTPNAAIRIPETVPALRIRYHAISFRTRRMLYACILEGYDTDWRVTWAEEARYERLPPGNYTFRVMAVNRDLVYSERPAALQFAVVSDPGETRLRALEREARDLAGLLPICSVCKRIRNNDGKWQHLEVFVSEHSRAEFSHGYCPKCAAETLAEAGRALPSPPP